MNLSLVRRRPVTRGPLTIPATPTVVYAETIDRFATVHRRDPDAPLTGCRLALWPFWRYTLAAVRRLEPHFCDGCWPGHRCVICGTPSGESDECARCVSDSLNVDKRIERAA